MASPLSRLSARLGVRRLLLRPHAQHQHLHLPQQCALLSPHGPWLRTPPRRWQYSEGSVGASLEQAVATQQQAAQATPTPPPQLSPPAPTLPAQAPPVPPAPEPQGNQDPEPRRRKKRGGKGQRAADGEAGGGDAGNPPALGHRTPKQAINDFRRAHSILPADVDGQVRRQWGRYHVHVRNGAFEAAMHMLRTERTTKNRPKTGPLSLNLDRYEALLVGLASEICSGPKQRVIKSVFHLEELEKMLQQDGLGSAPRTVAQFILGYAAAFARLAPGDYSVTTRCRKRTQPLLKTFASLGEISTIFCTAEATTEIFNLTQPVLRSSFPQTKFQQFDPILDVPFPKDTAYYRQYKNETEGMCTLETVLMDSEVDDLARTSQLSCPDTDEEVPRGTYDGLLMPFREKLVQGIRRDRLHFLDSKRRLRFFDHGIYLFAEGVLSDEMIADIVLAKIEEILINNAFGATSLSLSSEIGRVLFRRHCAILNKRNISAEDYELHRDFVAYNDDSELKKQHSALEYWQILSKKSITQPEGIGTGFASQWPAAARLRVGNTLLDIFMKNTSMRDLHEEHDDMAVIYHTYEFEGTKQIGFYRANDQLHTRMSGEAQGKRHMRTYETGNLPMLTVPKPWLSVRHGPYLVTPSNAVRCSDEAFQHFALLSAANDSMEHVYDALNYLGSIKWAVNHDILDMAIACFKTGRGYDALSVVPHQVEAPELVMLDDDNAETAKTRYYHECEAATKLQKEYVSQRADLRHRLTVAKFVRDEAFYLPHNMDFRGRTYPIPPHLNHLGSDLSRAMLKFGDGKPLGRTGLRWLKIHLSNLCGVDKVSFDDRVKFTEDNLSNVFHTADLATPVSDDAAGTPEWWQEQDSPWQVLATCKELAAALRSPDPEAYVSHLPVHQDGTCNGLQHYAALGGDVDGAKAVNLCPGEKPADVYTEVADRAMRMLRQHAVGSFNDPFFQDVSPSLQTLYQICAARLNEVLVTPAIRRKVFKQTVMTSVYGVTYVGAREQVQKQLKSLDLSSPANQFRDSSYLARLIFASLREMFSSAQEIQLWLAQCAQIVAASREPMTWITPLNLPVIQPYHKKQGFTVPASHQTFSVMDANDYTAPPDAQKQKTAFPPNFIHSLDSSHMMFTAISCRKQGVVFASVHDSYWTHASTVDAMRDATREEFVRLHSAPLLKDLTKFLRLHYEGRTVRPTKGNRSTAPPSPPEAMGDGLPTSDPFPVPSPGLKKVVIADAPSRGDFDIRQVLGSTYFFN